MRWTALGIAAACTAFWLWFGIASAMGEKLGPMNWLLHLVVPGGILLATLVVAWRWQFPGGILLLLEGLIVAAGYPLFFGSRFPWQTVAMVLLTMAVPPLAAGALLLAGRRGERGEVAGGPTL
jgi:hypothetical protein